MKQDVKKDNNICYNNGVGFIGSGGQGIVSTFLFYFLQEREPYGIINKDWGFPGFLNLIAAQCSATNEQNIVSLFDRRKRNVIRNTPSKRIDYQNFVLFYKEG